MANFGICSKWHDLGSSHDFKDLISLLRKGDVVQVKNCNFRCSSWGICISDGPNPTVAYRYLDLSFKKNAACNLQELKGLSTFDPGSIIRINNSKDKLTHPKSVQNILKDLETVARRFSGSSKCFRPLSWNGCRDFAEMVRYPAGPVRNRLKMDGCSEWYDGDGMETILWLLQEGDLVEFNKEEVYSHWAVCIDNPRHESTRMMVHRCGSETNSEMKRDLVGAVLYSSFEEVARGCRFRINNSWELKYKPMSLEPEFSQEYPPYSGHYTCGEYNARSNNSWHYVMRLRYRMNKRGNLPLRTQWYSSVKELRRLLFVGDIIRIRSCSKDGWLDQNWAVYIGYILDGSSPLVVQCRRSRNPQVLTTDSCIDNKRDDGCHPKKTDDITKEMVQEDGEKDHCQKDKNLSFENGSEKSTASECHHSSDPSEKAIVFTKSFAEFMKDSECCIDNRWDDGCLPVKVEDIVRKVLQVDGQENPCLCDCFGGNCPHFAFAIRYGEEGSTVLQKAFSCWWTNKNLETVQSEVLQEGDIVETKDGFISHFAIYVGNGQVVHRCERGCGEILDLTTYTMAKFGADKHFRVNNFWDHKLKVKKAEYVVQQAMDVREPISYFRTYDLTGNKCFDFVCQTRYELSLSSEEIDEYSNASLRNSGC